MFLFEAKEKGDWEPDRDHALAILERHGAKVIRQEKWAERKLAYEIKKVRRGIYFLTYFEADTDAIDAIRRDCGISDKILRVMILRCESLPEEKPAEAAAPQDESAKGRAPNAEGGGRPAEPAGAGAESGGGDAENVTPGE